ncbi:MAG: TonB-dependent receptor plug domain-containing protein, partial [Gammaproteobacteria bacterium]|nr:TonB-dependent receptor plug domain-containing protein [Gammaproteobacteria bacterium]
MSKAKQTTIRMCWASATVLVMAASTAVAQGAAAAEDSATLETVVITGTSIRGTEVIGSTVQTIDSAAIANSGRATVADLLRELPVNFAGGVAKSDNSRGGQDTASAGANLTGGQGVNLRGLGALSTLVLVDGRRVAASGQFGDFVDVANIPAAAIERIEILPDGASAIYGSDAVGGVVNIILKEHFEGIGALARYGVTTQGGGEELQASVVWGGRWDGGRAVVGYEYSDQKRIDAADRDFDGGDFSGRGGVNWPIYTSRVGSAANIFTGNAAFNGNVAYTVPQGPGTGLGVGSLTPAAGGIGNTSNPWQGVDILPAMKRHSIFTTFGHNVAAASEVYGSMRFTRRDGDYRTGYTNIYSTLPATSPFFIPGTTNNFSVQVDDRLTHRDVGVKSFGAELGFRATLAGDWEADFTVSYSREEQNRQ